MQTKETIEEIISQNMAVILYFSAPTCNVCHVLKPKIIDAINGEFPQFKFISVDISQTPEIAASFSVFAIPTVIVYLDSKEFIRKSRNMSVDELMAQIRRPYEIMTS